MGKNLDDTTYGMTASYSSETATAIDSTRSISSSSRAAQDEYARKAVSEYFKHSTIVDVDKSPEDMYPVFDQDELTLGKILGSGSSCTVLEAIHLCNLNIAKKQQLFGPNAVGKKGSLIRNQRRECGMCRYVVKRLSGSTLSDPTRCIQSLIDLGIESYFLSAIDHPNIIKMRAMSSCGLYQRESFLMLDHLKEIMDAAILRWSKTRQNISRNCIKMRRHTLSLRLMHERLQAAHGLSSALEYLHDRRIIYRDLKPLNCGFDAKGDIKLFDFGLAVELNPEERQEDGMYPLSANTGSPRYMAPEVARGEPYSFQVDMYSFAILLWEIIQLERPFLGYDAYTLSEQVVTKGKRPPIDPRWPSKLRSLLERGWSPVIKERPTIKEASSVIKRILVEMKPQRSTIE